MSQRTPPVSVVPLDFVEAARRVRDVPKDVRDPRAAFIERLYLDHWGDLCRQMRRLYGQGPPEPEDLVQSAFAKFAELPRFDHIDNPKAFLFRIAANLALKSIGHIARTRAFVASQLHDPEAELKEVGPERIFESRERLAAIGRAMEKLSSKQREIVLRSRIRGETYAQISATTGWSQADISRQLNAALALLESESEAPREPIQGGHV